jgi:hypothetical protein
MKNTLLASICVAALLALSSCYTVHLQNTGGPNANMGPAPGTPVGHFNESAHAHFLLWGLLNVGTPNVGEILAEQTKAMGGTSVGNLRVTTTHSFVDGLLSEITGGIYNPVTVEMEGDVVK